MELRQQALAAFLIADPTQKVQAVQQIWTTVRGLSAQALPLDVNQALSAASDPGRPERPRLVPPKEVPQRSPFTAEGHAALMHSIVHIEFNAIHLALDCVWRFADLPAEFYLDWMRVAFEESQHFEMLRAHLQRQGFDYGDFTAHNGLWELCHATRDDLAARMALVPRTLEARGLDATPIIQARLRQVGVARALEALGLLDIILREEVGHVATGNRWFHWACHRAGTSPRPFAEQVALHYKSPRPKPPYNLEARRRAGFSEEELAALPGMQSPV